MGSLGILLVLPNFSPKSIGFLKGRPEPKSFITLALHGCISCYGSIFICETRLEVETRLEIETRLEVEPRLAGGTRSRYAVGARPRWRRWRRFLSASIGTVRNDARLFVSGAFRHRIDAENGPAVREAAAVPAPAHGPAGGPFQDADDHAHHVLRQEEDEVRVLVQHPQRQVRFRPLFFSRFLFCLLRLASAILERFFFLTTRFSCCCCCFLFNATGRTACAASSCCGRRTRTAS